MPRPRLILVFFLLATAALSQSPSSNDPIKFADFGSVSQKRLKAILTEFHYEMIQRKTASGYIFCYGTNREIQQRERRIINMSSQISYHYAGQSRLVFMRGGESKVPRTVIWIVPEGGKQPEP